MLFPWYAKYPYQNDEVLNLDWILKTIDNLVKEVANFVTLNTIKYADPIQWNITTQYEKNTVVIDPISGSAYISTKPVPAGVGLNNTDYWNIIFTLDVISANKNITLRDDANNMLATFESAEDDWLLWQGTLYIVTNSIEIGQAYVDGYNIERYTVEMFLKDYISNLKNYVDDQVDAINDTIGSLEDLTTEDKTTVVAAINEVLTTIGDIVGDLSDLTTEDKTTLVAAINEIVSAISDISNSIGDLEDLDTTAKNTLVAAINEVVGNLGDLSDLDTTAKNNIVAAINEVLDDVNTRVDNSKVFNVRDYGAKGDGVTDDTTAIQAALSDALSAKGILYFPAGTYISNTIINILQGSGITILGCGNSVLKAGSSITLVKGTHTTNVKLINMIFEGYSSTNLPTIDCEFIGSYISGCKFINHGSNTAFLLRNHNNKIVNCEFVNDGSSGSSALKCGVLGGNDGENWTINNIIHGCYIESTSIGIHIARQTLAHLQEGLVIDDCIILGMGNSTADGIMIDALFAGTISNCVIDQWGRNGIYLTGSDMNANIKIQGCYIMGKQLSISAGGNNQIEAIIIDSNTIYTTDNNSGIFMNNISDVIISNNDFHVAWGAFNFAQTTKNVQFVNNFVEAASELGTLNSPAGNIIIKDNISNTLAINGSYVTDNPSYSFDAQGHVTITHTSNWTVQLENNITKI